MLDRITGFFRSIGSAIGRGFSVLAAGILWPFMAAHGWYQRRTWLVRLPVIAVIALFAVLYGYFVWQTQIWSGFNPNFVDQYRFSERKVAAGQEIPADASAAAAAATTTAAAPKTCQRSAIVDVTADLIDSNVNQNAWISSMLLYRMGLFGMDWDHTPFLDNKASFQRGVNQAVRRTSAELVDTLGRVRGTSGINSDLQDARGYLQYDEYSWYFGLDPFGPRR